MKSYRVCWVCLTGPKLGGWITVDEYFDTEEQAHAVAHEGFGPKPKAWWHVDILRRHSPDSFLFHTVSGGYVQRKRALALAELGLGVRAEAS